MANLHEKLLALDAAFDFVFCPCLLDNKKDYVQALADGDLTITFFNGAVRTSENAEMAVLLRAKTQILVAFGACSGQGGIPALSNLHLREEHMRANYLDCPTVDNPGRVLPQVRTAVPEGDLELPAFFETVKTLAQVVDVDYFMPGCPPEPHQIWTVVEAILSGNPLPPKGSTLGAGRSTVCQECVREREDKKVPRFYRTYEIVPDEKRCLLDQGILCMGVVTRGGCGSLCPTVNMPCAGCYGAPDGVTDQGAKMLAALGSILDVGDYKAMDEQQLAERAGEFAAGIPDLAGTLYRFGLGASVLTRRPK